MPGLKIFVDAGLELEMLAPYHAAPLLRLIHSNRDHLRRFLTWVDMMQHTDDMVNHIRDSLILHDQLRDISFVILVNGKVGGRVGLHHVVMQHQRAAIGYWLSAGLEGSGIMTRCCRAVINYGFETLNLNRIEIKAITANTKSQAIPVRLGFTKEAVLRQAELLNGKYEDLIVFSMLRQDWFTPGTTNTYL